jgi:hypothetical protein
MISTKTTYTSNFGAPLAGGNVKLTEDGFRDNNGKHAKAIWEAEPLPQDVPVTHDGTLVGRFSFSRMRVSSEQAGELDFKSCLAFAQGFRGEKLHYHFLQVILTETGFNGEPGPANHLEDPSEGTNRPYLDPPFSGYRSGSAGGANPGLPFFHELTMRKSQAKSAPHAVELIDGMGLAGGVEFLHSIAYCPLDLDPYPSKRTLTEVTPLLTFRVSAKKTWGASDDVPETVRFSIDQADHPNQPYKEDCREIMEKWKNMGRHNRTFCFSF